MSYITKKEKHHEKKTLREIIDSYGGHNYELIEVRVLIKCKESEEIFDSLYGYCQYIDGELYSLDRDIYSLEDKYIEWEEWLDSEGLISDKKQKVLTVWAQGYLF